MQKKKQKQAERKKINLPVAILAVAVLATVIIGIVATIHEKATEHARTMQEYYDAKCQSYGVQNANLAAGQIVFIGDSITDLYILDEHYADLPLAAYNRGIGGDTTAGVRKRLQVSVFDIAPAHVVLLVGANDILGGVSEEEILANYEAIITEIRSALPDATLYCMSIIPVNRRIESAGVDVDAMTATIRRLNPQIHQLAAQNGAVYLDLFEQLADEDGLLLSAYSDDGIHLNREGLLVWTKLLKPHLAKAIFH